MCLVPPAVQTRLHDPEAVALFAELGPVRRAEAGRITATLAELAARATQHQQTSLALALIGALRACEALSDGAVLAASA